LKGTCLLNIANWYDILITGYIFSNETIDALEEYSKKLAKSVMKRAEAICRNFDATNVGQLNTLFFPLIFIFFSLLFLIGRL
jgi:hypothetical protein